MTTTESRDFGVRSPNSSKFQKLRISGFKSLESVEVSFAQLTVLLGENSIGKSSIVQALLLLAENLKAKNGSKFQLNGQAVRLGHLSQVATVGLKTPLAIGVELSPTREGDPDRIFSVELDSRQHSIDSETQILSINIATGASQLALKKLRGQGTFGISGKMVGRGRIAAEVEFPAKATVRIGPGRQTGDFSSGLSEIPWEDFDEWKSARLDVRVPSKSSAAIIGVLVLNWLALERLMNDPLNQKDKQNLVSELKLEYLPLSDTLEQIWNGLPSSIELSEKYAKFISELEKIYFKPTFASYRNPLNIPSGSCFIGVDDLRNLESIVGQFLIQNEIPEKGVWFEKVDTGEAFQEYQEELVNLLYDISHTVQYVGPIRQASTGFQRNDVTPDDVTPVGIAGELTGLVLARSLGTKTWLALPLPPGIEKESFDLIEATEQWCKYFGIGHKLEVRNLGLAGLEVLLDGKPLHALGTGVSQLLPVIVLCLTSKLGALIVVEQPELHLHPGAQQKLADFFLQIINSGKQILVETHSEYLVTRLRRAVVVSKQAPETVALQFVERDKDGKVQVQRSDLAVDGTFGYWPKGFFQQTDDDLLAILEASFGDF